MMPWLKQLRTVTQQQAMVKGAVNYDEDLHFSTYYLRASTAAVTGSLYPGYSCIIASYESFNETYYLREDECQRTARALIEKGLQKPRFLPRILAEIRQQSDALSTIFPPHTTAASLSQLTNARLLALYRRHDAANRRLYRVARLPEALDRGDNHFTRYLIDHLTSTGVSAASCSEVFSILSQPSTPSVLASEIGEFDELVKLARACTPATGETRRARMLLDPDLYRRLDAHREKWQYLAYHGYGRRQLSSFDQYLGRLFEQLRSPNERSTSTERYAHSATRRKERQALLRQLKLDASHSALFEIYPEIGAVKLHRRYAQLRNFYFLDLLIAEIAQRLAVSEWTIRSMLPEEIMASLQCGKRASSAIRDRLRPEGCVYVFLNGREYVASGRTAIAVRELVRPAAATAVDSSNLSGTVACRGKAKGPCRIVIRADDCRIADFAKGTILVSESTDPDLLPFIRAAGAVLTEQGGVTSHAAIICRELNVPTVIGIDGLLDRVKDGDWLEVDAERGSIEVRRKGERFESTSSVAMQAMGAKAQNLGKLRALGFAVPRYITLDYDHVRRVSDGEDSALAQLSEKTLGELALSAEDRLAVRSSAVYEDREEGSAAGAYHSLLDVAPAPQALGAALRDFVTRNHLRHDGRPYQGAIIVQQMIDADWAGVCLTQDSRTRHKNAVIIEMTRGGNTGVTGGTTRPDRLIVDRLSGDILEQRRVSATAQHRSLEEGFDLSEMVRQFLMMESWFGRPLDIEWALTGQQLYILQVRPIVLHAETQHSFAPRSKDSA